MPSTTVLTLDEIKSLVDIGRLIEEIETGFVLYSEGQAKVPPVGFLHFEEPPGDVHIKYGYLTGDTCYVLKVASAFYENTALGLPANDGLVLVFNQKTGSTEFILLDEGWLTDMRWLLPALLLQNIWLLHKFLLLGLLIRAYRQNFS
ncbi:MAG: hypothetical protein AB8G77_28255 [Rhodothermales bacterium]